MRRAAAWGGLLPIALALAGACARDRTTTLDLALDIEGEIDQFRIDRITLDGAVVSLPGQPLFPMPARKLVAGDVLTLLFADGDGGKNVIVTATGRRCGKDVTPQVTATQTLATGQAVKATLSLHNSSVNSGIVCDNDGGSGDGGGSGGAGGHAGATGAGGASGTGGAATAGTSGVAGSAAGAAGRGGTTGTAGTTGTTGTGGGTAGRGGTTGTAGTGGGTAGRGGTTGTAGAGAGCATTPVATSVVVDATPVPAVTSCGYQQDVATPSGFDYTLTPLDAFAYANSEVFDGGLSCGRCAEFALTTTGQAPKREIVTIVGQCDATTCPPGMPRFALSPGALQQLTTGQFSLPGAGQTLTYSFVPCPVNATAFVLAQPKSLVGVGTGVVFFRSRYGIRTAEVEITAGTPLPMHLGPDGYWTVDGGNLGSGMALFRLTDVNYAQLEVTLLVTSPTLVDTKKQFPACAP